MTTDWTPTAPLDSNSLSGGAGEIRALKQAIIDRVSVEHSFVSTGSDPNDGRHLLANGLYSARPSPDIVGRAYISADTKMVSFTTGAAEWFDLPFPAGTTMMFNQATAPLGWTRSVAVNDSTILITAAGTGGSTGGSWAISGVTSGAYTLQTADMPSHTHGVYIPSGGYDLTILGTAVAGTGTNTSASGSANVLTSVGGGGAHSHPLTIDGTWRPAYQYVILATKN